MKTIKELKSLGWMFITMSGGAKVGSRGFYEHVSFKAKTLPTLRKKITKFLDNE